MDETITDKNFPLDRKWILKGGIVYIPLLIIIILFDSFYLFAAQSESKFPTIFQLITAPLIMGIIWIILVLSRINLHYSITDKFLTIDQGILSKQQRNIPYGVIQNVIVKQGLLDRILALASVLIENASQSGGKGNNGTKLFGMRINTQNKRQLETIGFKGNKVSIPGLTKQNAEALKNIILERIKANPIEELGL